LNFDRKLAICSALFAILTFFIALAVSISLDVRTKGEYVFVVVCFALSAFAFAITAFVVTFFLTERWWKRLLISAIVLGLTPTGFFEILGWVNTRRAAAEGGFVATFHGGFINTSRKLDQRGFWGLYKSATGATIAPVALLLFLDLESRYRDPVSITQYSVALDTTRCGWISLSPISSQGRGLVLVDDSASSVGAYGLFNQSFDVQWATPFSPFGQENGLLLFDSKVVCPIEKGSVVTFRLDITDSTGKQSSFSSQPMTVLENFDAGSPNLDPNAPYLNSLGIKVDVRSAFRRLYSDPISDSAHGEEGFVRTWESGRPVKIILENGLYTMRSPDKPLW
jgi:hypothetical protein